MRNLIRAFLDSPPIQRVRRNHALEHATIHVLSARHPRTTLIGRADSEGFYLFGEVSTQAVEEAAQEALRRLRAGEHELAIHPNCGTNFLTAGLLAAGASFLSLGMGRDQRFRARLERLPTAVLLTTLALLVAQPLGAAAQQHLTTLGDPGDLEIVEVRRYHRGGRTVHRVLTRG